LAKHSSDKAKRTSRHAIIDIGSNTIRLVIFEVDRKNETFSQVFNKKIMAGLAGYVDEGSLSERGIHRAQEALESHLRRLRTNEADTVSAFATAVIRNAKNGEEVARLLEERCGIHIEILTAEEEALLGNFGALQAFGIPDGVTMDMGGASTEVVVFRDRKPLVAKSLPFGSLTLWLEHVEGLFPTGAEQREIRDFVEGPLFAIPGFSDLHIHSLIGIGGAARAASKLADHLYHDDTKTRRVETSQMHQMLARCSEMSKPELLDLVQAVPDRIHTVLPGMLCIYTAARLVHADELLVSPYGIREGYLCARVMGVSR